MDPSGEAVCWRASAGRPLEGRETGRVPTFGHSQALAAPSCASNTLSYRLANFHQERRLKMVADPSTTASDDGAALPRSPVLRLPAPSVPVDDASSAVPAAALCEPLKEEDDEGDVEYKWRLTGISRARFEHLVTQMQFRVSEGRGQCLYELGVADNGEPKGLPEAEFEESVDTVHRMARTLGFDSVLLQRCVVQLSPQTLICGELLVSRRHAGGQDLSLCFCGAVGSGKSTLMGALLTSTLDDGHGGARQSLFNHKHEIDSGHTTSIATRMWSLAPPLDRAADGNEANGSDSDIEVSLLLASDGVEEGRELADACAGSTSAPEHGEARDSGSSAGETVGSPTAPIASSDSDVNATQDGTSLDASASPRLSRRRTRKPRLISLMDAGGNIAKSSLFGLMSRAPDYVCLCVAADASAEEVGLYAQVACAIGTPFLVAVTRTDAVEDFELDSFCMDIAATLRGTGCACDVIETQEKALEYCRGFLPQHHDGGVDGSTESVAGGGARSLRVPLFCVSSVTGSGLELLKHTIAHLRPPAPAAPLSPLSATTRPPFEVLLDYSFHVAGVGSVVRGRVSGGSVEVGCSCYIGPDDNGAFFPIVLRGIHVDGAHVNEAQVGDEATFAVDRVPASVDLSRKGKVLLRQPKNACSEFRLAVRVLAQSLTPNIEPILYTRNARQAVKVESYCARSPILRPSSVSGISRDGRPRSTAAVEEEFEMECRFLFRPELLTHGAAVALRWEPHGIAVGKISRLGPRRSE